VRKEREESLHEALSSIIFIGIAQLDVDDKWIVIRFLICDLTGFALSILDVIFVAIVIFFFARLYKKRIYVKDILFAIASIYTPIILIGNIVLLFNIPELYSLEFRG
jgi:hypothetical protein